MVALGYSTGARGATVSSTKLVLPDALVLPAASTALALTLTVACPSVASSLTPSATTCAAPLALRVLLSVWPLALKLSKRLVPASATTVTAPLLAAAALWYGVLALSSGAVGARVSSTKLVATDALSTPAARAVALTLTVP